MVHSNFIQDYLKENGFHEEIKKMLELFPDQYLKTNTKEKFIIQKTKESSRVEFDREFLFQIHENNDFECNPKIFLIKYFYEKLCENTGKKKVFNDEFWSCSSKQLNHAIDSDYLIKSLNKIYETGLKFTKKDCLHAHDAYLFSKKDRVFIESGQSYGFQLVKKNDELILLGFDNYKRRKKCRFSRELEQEDIINDPDHVVLKVKNNDVLFVDNDWIEIFPFVLEELMETINPINEPVFFDFDDFIFQCVSNYPSLYVGKNHEETILKIISGSFVQGKDISSFEVKPVVAFHFNEHLAPRLPKDRVLRFYHETPANYYLNETDKENEYLPLVLFDDEVSLFPELKLFKGKNFSRNEFSFIHDEEIDYDFFPQYHSGTKFYQTDDFEKLNTQWKQKILETLKTMKDIYELPKEEIMKRFRKSTMNYFNRGATPSIDKCLELIKKDIAKIEKNIKTNKFKH